VQSNSEQGNTGHVFRVDKFVVPQAARDEFLSRVGTTHEVLRKQPGFIGDNVLEQFAGPGEFNIVTIVEWESQAHIEAAKAAVTARHGQANINPQELLQRLGIKGDIAHYRQVEA